MKTRRIFACLLALVFMFSLFACDDSDVKQTESDSVVGSEEDENGDASKHVHAFDVVWTFDNESHWKKCECGATEEKAEHLWRGKGCGVCGMSKPEGTPDVTTVKDKDEWLKIFAVESFVNVTFDITSHLDDNGDGDFEDTYSKIMIDGTKAKAAEKITSKEQFDEKASYYAVGESLYKRWNKSEGKWDSPHNDSGHGIDHLIESVYDDNVLIFARDYFENYSYDEQNKAYVWNTGVTVIEFYIVNGVCVRMVFSFGDLSIVTEFVDYGTTAVTYPTGVPTP